MNLKSTSPDQAFNAHAQAKCFYPSRSRCILIFFISSLFMAQFVYDFSKKPIISIIGVAFCGLFVTGSFLSFISGTPRLEVTSEGLTIRQLKNVREVKWAEVKDIRVGWIDNGQKHWSYSRRVFVNFRRGGKDSRFIMPTILYGISAETLIEGIIPFCTERPQLIETMLADCKQRALVSYKL